ncbi:MAG: enoyl-CoA hydratase/isomerase family protein [Syntrophobacterales bacterium]|jgi:2-(1,2-epoxy-1,2-dihydrophenyl)acetyl-CoA isomerase|nr:enoyl-CoA hydratase/isomerase family protein [Syntrophobacterales bacterium]
MDAVKEDYKDGICTLTLNRPNKKNAMDSELLPALYQALQNAEAAKSQVVIIRGSGKAFCAGGDIVEFRQSEDTASRIDFMADELHKSILLIRKMGAIVVAAVEGVAVGAGLGLALACDITVAARNTVMNMGYRKIGLTPDGGGSIFLSRIVGAKKFSELYLFSRNITMNEALDLGLVNFVWDEESFEERLQKMIADLTALPMETIPYFKDLVNHSVYTGLDIHLDKERFYVSELGGKPQFKERLDQFFSKK